MYLTTTVSVAMVLFLIGLECMLLLSAHYLIKSAKENLTLTLVMTADSDSTSVARLQNILEAMPSTLSYQYISKQTALEQHINSLGEDPTRFLGYNPLPDAYELHLKDNYAVKDSIIPIVSRLESLPYIDKVEYQEDIVQVLDHTVNKVSLLLAALALVLLIIAWMLIINTIRLHIYSKRFLINTMRLVGATPWVIRMPFIRRSMRVGLEAALITIVLLGAVYYYVQYSLNISLFPPTWQNMLILASVVLLSGLIITFLASLIATGRYVRMNIDRMYEI